MDPGNIHRGQIRQGHGHDEEEDKSAEEEDDSGDAERAGHGGQTEGAGCLKLLACFWTFYYDSRRNEVTR